MLKEAKKPMAKMASLSRDPLLLAAVILWFGWWLAMLTISQGVGAAPMPTIALDAIALPGAPVTLSARADSSLDGTSLRVAMVAPGFEPPPAAVVTAGEVGFSVTAPQSVAFYPWVALDANRESGAASPAARGQVSTGILEVIAADRPVILVAIDGTVSLEPFETISSEAPPLLRPGTGEALSRLAASAQLVALTGIEVEYLPHLRRWWRGQRLPRVVFQLGGSEIIDNLTATVGKIDAAIVGGGRLETAARVRKLELHRIGGNSRSDWKTAADTLLLEMEKDD